MAVATKQFKILLINPNSSTSITEDFKDPISKLGLSNILVSYWTNVKGPPVIQDQKEINETSAQCLEPLAVLAPQYDGFLVACYADHTLTSILGERVAPKPVLGIFDASISACTNVLVSGTRFGILTTGKSWEESLTAGAKRLLGSLNSHQRKDSFAGVIATKITATVLKEESTAVVKDMLLAATLEMLRRGSVKAICLGGVILSGMQNWVMEACILELGTSAAAEVNVIEPVTVGMLALQRLLHA